MDTVVRVIQSGGIISIVIALAAAILGAIIPILPSLLRRQRNRAAQKRAEKDVQALLDTIDADIQKPGSEGNLYLLREIKTILPQVSVRRFGYDVGVSTLGSLISSGIWGIAGFVVGLVIGRR